MDIGITVAGDELRGSLDDTATARDFAALLPLTLTLDDFAGPEKVADLPRRLDTTGAPPAHTGRPGDIAYYAPWRNLAQFYGTGRDAAGLIRLGRLAPRATEEPGTPHGQGDHHPGHGHPTGPQLTPGGACDRERHAGHCDQARHPGHPDQPPNLLGSQPRPDRTVRSPYGPHPAK